MPRRRRKGKDGFETVLAVLLLVVTMGTAWSALADEASLTILLGMATVSLIIALGLSGRRA